MGIGILCMAALGITETKTILGIYVIIKHNKIKNLIEKFFQLKK